MQILRETKLEALAKSRELGPKKVLDLLKEKELVGRGGAAFLTSKKWGIARNTKSDKKYIICNADEGEPGTFKDKFIIKYNAKTLIEGILIAAEVVGAKICYFYLRGEYEYLREKLEHDIKHVLIRANSEVDIIIVRGAGSYVCGEESAIIQSIMGNRGQPQYKPPYPPVEGLWGKPTIVNNVETLICAAQAILYEDWKPNLRLFSLSGNLSNPGVYELPLGVKMSSIMDIAQPDKKIKAITFGAFGGIMKVDEDMIINLETIRNARCHHGSFSIIFIDESKKIIDVCYSIAKFYAYESCGKCTPCREGTVRILNILKKIKSKQGDENDLVLLEEIAHQIQDTSLCGLGMSAGNHIITSLKHFRNDFERLIQK